MTKTQKAVSIFSIILLCIVVGIAVTVITNQRANATIDKTGNMMDPEIPLPENTYYDYYDVISGMIDKYGVAIIDNGLNSGKGGFLCCSFRF